MKLHKWYYQKRNSIAHYRAIHEPVKLDAADWNTMIKFNFEVIEYLSLTSQDFPTQRHHKLFDSVEFLLLLAF